MNKNKVKVRLNTTVNNKQELPSTISKQTEDKGEKNMTTAVKETSAMMKSFIEYQERAEEWFKKFGKTRARDDRAHEEQMLRLLLESQSNASGPFPAMYYRGQNYDADFQNDSYGSSDYLLMFCCYSNTKLIRCTYTYKLGEKSFCET